MFIRVKRVKKRSGKIYEYAQIVEGIWRQRRIVRLENNKWKFRKFNNSLHSYRGFVGRVYRFLDIKKSLDLESYIGCNFDEFVEVNDIEEVYRRVVEYELLRRGFVYHGRVLTSNGIFVDLHRLIVYNGKGDVVAKIKEISGYLCSLSLNELFDIKKINGRVEGISLMKKLRMVGVELNPEQFYVLVNKLLSQE